MKRACCVCLIVVWLGPSPAGAGTASEPARHETKGRVGIRLGSDAQKRARFGAERLSETLRRVGYEPIVTTERELIVPLVTVTVERQTGPATRPADRRRSAESYRLSRERDGSYHVTGFGESGALYGCLELSQRVIAAGKLPGELEVTDGPAFRLRGSCVAMQLTSILPGRDTYEYPYTPENFPFFYDQAQWIEYLDFLAENRFNTLYLWNGHPFASLVKLPEYPYALEVSEEVYQRNVRMYRFLTEEADRRGIWVVQMFYNIFVSKPLAEHHGIKTQHRAHGVDSRLQPQIHRQVHRDVSERGIVGLPGRGLARAGEPGKVDE